MVNVSITPEIDIEVNDVKQCDITIFSTPIVKLNFDSPNASKYNYKVKPKSNILKYFSNT